MRTGRVRGRQAGREEHASTERRAPLDCAPCWGESAFSNGPLGWPLYHRLCQPFMSGTCDKWSSDCVARCSASESHSRWRPVLLGICQSITHDNYNQLQSAVRVRNWFFQSAGESGEQSAAVVVVFSSEIGRVGGGCGFVCTLKWERLWCGFVCTLNWARRRECFVIHCLVCLGMLSFSDATSISFAESLEQCFTCISSLTVPFC